MKTLSGLYMGSTPVKKKDGTLTAYKTLSINEGYLQNTLVNVLSSFEVKAKIGEKIELINIGVKAQYYDTTRKQFTYCQPQYYIASKAN